MESFHLAIDFLILRLLVDDDSCLIMNLTDTSKFNFKLLQQRFT